jgi:manganese/iron transport system permease protein/iron/zinc/copper transport system permease protein
MSWLVDPLRDYEFFRNAVVAGSLAGALCGLVGVYVVLRRMSYIGHGLSHAIFGGAVASYVLQVNFFLGAGLWGLLAALLINSISRRRQIGADAAIGIVTTASFAFGVALISSVHRYTVNFDAALFGNILGVSRGDVLVLAGVTVAVVSIVFLRYRSLLFATFDPEVAGAYGVNVRALDALFALILAATVVSTMRILGVTLIAAMIVTPAIAARLLTDSFSRMLGISTLTGALCGVTGMYLSFYLGPASGATIVLVATGIFTILYLGTALVGRRRLAHLDAPAAGLDTARGPAPDIR